jgi:hypothetical protein
MNRPKTHKETQPKRGENKIGECDLIRPWAKKGAQAVLKALSTKNKATSVSK